LIVDAAINRPAVIAEVRAAFDDYEAALRAHDVTRLNDYFLPRADTVRFGLDEHNFGAAAIAAWRRGAKPVSPDRRIVRVIITGFGDDTASVSAEFQTPDSQLIGRQSQLWVRVAGGWKIAAAHVSEIDPVRLGDSS